MMTDEKIYFEISDSSNFIRLEPIEVVNYKSELDWDRAWVKTSVKIKGGSFSGQYLAEFTTLDFEKFKREFSKLYHNLKGTAYFSDLERYLELKIIGDGIGHYTVDIRACDQLGMARCELTFSLEFDQTQIKNLTNQLENITKEFPITGDFRMRNE